MEGTRITDRLFLKIRTILAEANATDSEDDSPPCSPTSRSMQSSLDKHVYPSPSVTPNTPCPYPSPSTSPSVRPEAVRMTRRFRVPRPLPAATGQVGRMPRTPGTPGINGEHSRPLDIFSRLLNRSLVALDPLGISKVPCSTPVQPGKETEKSISQTFLHLLEGIFLQTEGEGNFLTITLS